MAKQGRVAIVTGASSGIGKASTAQLTKDGYSVAMLARTPDKLKAAKDEIQKGGGNVQDFACDVSNVGDLTATLEKIQKQMGSISTIVNVAGFGGTPQTVDLMSLEEFDQTIGLNVRTPFMLAKTLFPEMKKNGFGRMINIASILSLTGADLTSLYTTSKHALVGLTRALAAEWGRHGLTVNAICPGYTNTPILQGYQFQNLGERLPTPGGKMGVAEYHAEIVGFLAQESTHYLNGSIIVADGGLTSDLGIK